MPHIPIFNFNSHLFLKKYLKNFIKKKQLNFLTIYIVIINSFFLNIHPIRCREVFADVNAIYFPGCRG